MDAICILNVRVKKSDLVSTNEHIFSGAAIELKPFYDLHIKPRMINPSAVFISG